MALSDYKTLNNSGGEDSNNEEDDRAVEVKRRLQSMGVNLFLPSPGNFIRIPSNATSTLKSARVKPIHLPDYTKQDEMMLIQWINEILAEEAISKMSLMGALKDGVILCRYA